MIIHRLLRLVLGVWLLTAFLKSESTRSQTARVDPARKLALIVGISNYEWRHRGQPPDWWNLSCQTDVETMKQVLRDRFGFPEKDILLLTDAKATRQGIIDAFQRHLIGQAHPGDVVVFHYSGHGQEVPGVPGHKERGIDQSLVPYDYQTQTATDGGTTNLRDLQISALLSDLREKMKGDDGKVDGNITVILDCCFSGTATRGGEKGRLTERGRRWIRQLDGPVPRPQERGKPASAGGLLTRGEAFAQGYVVIAACRSDQTAKEWTDSKNRPVGALTYFLSRAMMRAGPQTTYRALFEKVKVELEACIVDQNPQLEGDMDKLLFKGVALPHEQYIVVESIEGNKLTLPVGELHGATVGSVYGIFRPGTSVSDEKNRITEAKVVEMDTTTCVALIAENDARRFGPDTFVAARAVESLHNFGEQQLRVFSDRTGPLLEALKAQQMLKFEGVSRENCDVLIFEDHAGLGLKRRSGSLDSEVVIARNRDGTDVLRVPDSTKSVALIRDALIGEWRWRFLSQLNNTDTDGEGISVGLRVIPCEVELNGKDKVRRIVRDRTDISQSDGNELILHKDDYVRIEIENKSKFEVYITVLDLSPDGSINPVYPHPDVASTTDENKVKAGQILRLPERYVFQMTPPFGREMFKLIATKAPADFSPLVHSKTIIARGEKNVMNNLRGELSPLGQLLLTATTGKRGTQRVGVEPKLWATAQALFVVEKRQNK